MEYPDKTDIHFYFLSPGYKRFESVKEQINPKKDFHVNLITSKQKEASFVIYFYSILDKNCLSS